MNFTRKRLGVAGAALVAACSVGGYALASTATASPTYPVTPTGQTYGTLPSDGTQLPLAGLPDLVKVVGDHGIEGYAASSDVLGVGDAAPATPELALAQQKLNVTRAVPVYAADGTVVDTFTIAGSDAGGVETTQVP